MKKRLISLICVVVLIFSSLLYTSCGSPSDTPTGPQGEQITLTFQYDDNTTAIININKGKFLLQSDLPTVQNSSLSYEYTWDIDLSNPITESKTIKTLRYTKGVKFSVSGKKAKVTGMMLADGQPKPTTLFLPTYYQGAVVTVIDQKAFRAYEDYQPSTELRHVILPKYLETIGYEAFEFCRKLEAPDFPETLTFVGSNAFNACSFDKLELPETLTNLAKRAFGGGNHTFSFVKVPGGVTVMESFAIVSKVLRVLVIPKSVTKIEDGGIWPIEPNYLKDEGGNLVYENGHLVPIGYEEFKIFYEGNIFDWEDLYANISDVDVANVVGDGNNDDFDALIELHSSKDQVDMATLYIYSETEPRYDVSHKDNKYWCYDENGDIYIWDDPVA